jgi:hypothetical protein
MECMGIVHSSGIPEAPPVSPESVTFGSTIDDLETDITAKLLFLFLV